MTPSLGMSRRPCGRSAGEVRSDLVRGARGDSTSGWCPGFRRLAIRVLVTTVAAVTAGCDAPRHSAIVMVVDTLRADHMSLYGYPRATTPEIDSFARDAVNLTKGGYELVSVTPYDQFLYAHHVEVIGHFVRRS